MRNWYDSKFHKGVKALISHEETSFDYIQDAVKLHQPELVIEFGSAYFGLTLLLHEASPNTILHTFDFRDGKEWMGKAKGLVDASFMFRLCEVAFNENVTFHVADLLSGEGNEFVLELLHQRKRTFLYCDNGDKPTEVELYAKHLRAGDILGVHDWPKEINSDIPKVAKALEKFTPHEFNVGLKEVGASTRMFVCRGKD